VGLHFRLCWVGDHPRGCGEQELAREESEAALRRARAATAVSPGLAQEAYEQAQRITAEVHDRTGASVEPAPPGDRDEDVAHERADNIKRLAELQRRREMAAVPSWKVRPYGTKSDEGLRRAIGLAYEAAGIAERGAQEAAEKARVLEERLALEKEAGQTRGQAFTAEAATLLAQAEKKAQEAAEQLAREATARARAEELDRYLTERLEPKKDMSRIALRLAGTSKKELAELTAQITGERAAWRTEESAARRAARDARVEAWEMIRTSRFAGHFRDVGAQQFSPADVETVRDRLQMMREQLPDIELRIDRRDAQNLTRLQGEAAKFQQAAVQNRRTVEAGRAERARRAEIAKKYPELHDIETKARAAYAVQRKREAMARSRAAQEAPSTTYYRHDAPSQGRRGPSAGR
jgi:hypothetical protein